MDKVPRTNKYSITGSLTIGAIMRYDPIMMTRIGINNGT